MALPTAKRSRGDWYAPRLLMFSVAVGSQGRVVALVLWRLSWGGAKGHPLAPTMAGAVVAFGVVGLFDSLLDVPRVAFLFYFLLLLALIRHPHQRVMRD